ncbi:cytokinin riboside 5'-monophosphate phosphoribohydrolase [Aureibacter tunicatorum]|nr:cytokinin riboside 5'-monophosphate phosphoribohydrolase [Aureibacter tunicatorum]
MDFLARYAFDFRQVEKQMPTGKSMATVFGSARVNEGTYDYENAYAIGRELALHGYSVVTGGGKGIMEAANKGAFETANSNAESIGICLKQYKEQEPNKFLDIEIQSEVLEVRKHFLIYSSRLLIAMPGGFGTLDELSEVLALKRKGLLKETKLILMHREFWSSIDKWMEECLGLNYLSPHERSNMLTILDTPSEIKGYL